MKTIKVNKEIGYQNLNGILSYFKESITQVSIPPHMLNALKTALRAKYDDIENILEQIADIFYIKDRIYYYEIMPDTQIKLYNTNDNDTTVYAVYEFIDSGNLEERGTGVFTILANDIQKEIDGVNNPRLKPQVCR